MNGIVEISGRQYNVKVGDLISVDKMDKKKDEEFIIDRVLLVKNKDNKIITGEPYIKNAKIKVKVLEEQIRDAKVLVFKYKRKKNYKRLRGHKQPYTVLKIEDIVIA